VRSDFLDLAPGTRTNAMEFHLHGRAALGKALVVDGLITERMCDKATHIRWLLVRVQPAPRPKRQVSYVANVTACNDLVICIVARRWT
jgi:hypothetical protein